MSANGATPMKMTRRQKFKDGARRMGGHIVKRVTYKNTVNALPVFAMLGNLSVVIFVIVAKWIGNPLGAEMPYDWKAPFGSLVLSLLMMWYTTQQYFNAKSDYKAGTSSNKPSKVSIITGVVGLLLTGSLVILAILYPTKDPCCPGGQIADRVKKGSCKPGSFPGSSPGPASSPEGSSPEGSSPEGSSPEGSSPEGSSPGLASSPGPASSPEGASVTE